jgi:hypothetical protein
MFSFIYPYGHPFDPTLDVNFTEPSKGGRLTGELKRATKANLTKHDNKLLTSMFDNLFSLDKYSFAILGKEEVISNVVKSDFTEDTKRHIDLISKYPAKKKNRYFLANDDLYVEAVRVSYKDRQYNHHENKHINVGIFNYCQNVLGVNDYFDKKDSYPIVNEYAGNIKFENKELARALFAIKMDARLVSNQEIGPLVLNTIMEMAFSDLENEKNIKDSITCIWSMSKFFANPNIFYIAYYYFSDLFKVEDFPFLRFSILNQAKKKISEDGVIDRYSSYMIIASIDNVISDNEDYEGSHRYLSNVFENKEAFIDKYKDTEKAFRTINKMSISLIGEVKVYDEDRYESLIKDFIGIDVSLGCYISSNVLSKLNQDVRVRFDQLLYNMKDGINYSGKVKDIKSQIKELEDRSMVLARAPLENIEALTDLSVRKKEFDENLNVFKEKIANIIEPLIVGLKETQDYYTQSIGIEIEKFRSSKNDREILEIALNDNEEQVQLRINAQDKINLLESKISELNREKERDDLVRTNHSFNKDLSGTLIDINSGSASIEDVVNVVVMINGESFTIRQSLMAEVAKNIEFQKTELLFKKLLLLTSRKFVDEYNKNGSNGCFSLFTKTELSFQETKATQKLHPRVYKIDGVDYDCKAHLKIGSDNTEQNMLRIYFSVEKDKVIIGDIVKHLPIIRKI